jgi:hypothetical protein
MKQDEGLLYLGLYSYVQLMKRIEIQMDENDLKAL